MREVDRTLVNREDKLVKLLAPPFDQSEIEPGYIKGYVRVFGKTAVNTHMQQSGRQWLLPLWATGARLGCVKHHQSDQPMRIPEEVDAYKVEPYVVASDVYSSTACRTGRDGHGFPVLPLDVPVDCGISAGPFDSERQDAV
jgi:cellobiose phosphorylase